MNILKTFWFKDKIAYFGFLFSSGVWVLGITLYAPAIILNALFGWDFKWIVFFSGLGVILYTISGGANEGQ